MTIIEKALAYLAGEAETLPAANTETERLLIKAAQKIKAGLLPAPAAPVSPAASADANKIPTVKNDGTYELAAIPTELPNPSGVTDGYVLTAASGEATWAALPADETAAET